MGDTNTKPKEEEIQICFGQMKKMVQGNLNIEKLKMLKNIYMKLVTTLKISITSSHHWYMK